MSRLKKYGKGPKDGGDGTGMVDFKGERRTNLTHQSSTDPETKVIRRMPIPTPMPMRPCY